MPFYRFDHAPDPMEKAGFSPEEVPRAITAIGADLVAGMVLKEMGVHFHRKAQLIFTLRGIVRCEADDGVWIVPPHCAVWIPGGMPHSAVLSGAVEIYCLFVDPDAAPALPAGCCTVAVSPLLEQLLRHAAHMPVMYDEDGPDGRIATVLLDQLARAPVEQLNFPMPQDPRLRRIAAALMADPADRATIEAWGKRMAAAPRTLTRALTRETGLSFGRWRQQLHILIALQRLDQGAAVQSVAQELGYESAGAFVTMFRKALGKPPARYLAERRRQDGGGAD